VKGLESLLKIAGMKFEF